MFIAIATYNSNIGNWFIDKFLSIDSSL